MGNPYFIDEPAAISFSGGRTSAYMLYKILEAHGGTLPEDVKVTFANTGKEMPQTLDFVKECGENWDVEIIWLERYAEKNPLYGEPKENKYKYATRITNHGLAARNGEPFAGLIKARRYAPNPVARFCTVDMKIRAISEYMLDIVEAPSPYIGVIGIRADEVRRAKKMHGIIESGQERYLPLYLDGKTKEDVCDFWDSMPFDLQLPNDNGVTPFGNCDLCFLKGLGRKMSIIRARPDLADWWIDQEEKLSNEVGKGAYFRADQPSYAQMKEIALTQPDTSPPIHPYQASR